MGADTVTLSGLEKDVYEKSISEGVNNSFDLKDWFKAEDADWNGGAGHVWSHHHGRNNSPFFANEDSAYPVAGNQKHSKGRVGMKKIMGRIRMTEEAMEDLVSSEASFRNGMTDEKTRLIDDISRRENHAIGMDGRGVLALVNEADPDGNTTLILDAPGNIAGVSFGNRFIDEGMFLGFVNPATGALRTQAGALRSVTAVSADGLNVTLSSATVGTDVADNDYVVMGANATTTDILDTSFEAGYWGLPALVDDGTNRDNYFGILRSQVESLKSYVVSSVGAMSMDVAQRTSDVVFNKLNGVIDGIAMHTSVRREWLKITDADRRYSGADLRNPDPSTKAFTQGDVTVDSVVIKALRSVGLAQVYFTDSKKAGFKRYVAEPGKFMDKDGSMWVREGTGTAARHAYEATYFRRQQLFSQNPGVNARWDGVTGQTLIVVRDL
jgi:hypothetical protein